jgi:hypothetical protein
MCITLVIVQFSGQFLQTFRDNLSAPSSEFKNPKKKKLAAPNGVDIGNSVNDEKSQ